MDKIERFDFEKLPKKERIYLTPIAYLLSFPSVWRRRLKEIGRASCRERV